MRFGFVGPHLVAESPLVSAEQTINLRVKKADSPNARVPFYLVGSPGLSLYAALGNFPTGVRGSYTAQGRTFKVAGTHLFEITGQGQFTDYGGFGGNNNMIDDGLPVTMVAGGTVGGNYPSQLLIASGGAISVFSLVSNSFQALTTPPSNILMVDFLGGFFCALSTGNTWSVSAVEDATTWPGTSVAQISIFSDQLLSLIECNELIWVFGAKQAAAYYLSGAPLFPFDVTNGGVVSIGIAAQFSPARIQSRQFGKSLAWLGGDDQGAGVVYVLNGFTPQRISDEGFEYWASQQTTLSDAVGMARQDEGQNFYDLWFPSANVTWSFDVDLGFAHQRSSLVAGKQSAHLQRCHTFNFGAHLIGDRTSGNVYQMGEQFFSENVGVGVFNPIIRTRIGPTISSEGGQLTVPINEFQVDFEMGLGPQPPLLDYFGNPRDPYASFSYSEDFAKTWTPERMIALGQAGQSRKVAIDRRLGSWRNWTPKVVIADPIPVRILDAYTNGTQDSSPRLAKSLAKIA